MHKCTITEKEIEDKLVLLRKRWVEKPLLRKITLRQARALQIAKEKLENKNNKTANFLKKRCTMCKSEEFINDICVVCHPPIDKVMEKE